jgi:transposase-like protein
LRTEELGSLELTSRLLFVGQVVRAQVGLLGQGNEALPPTETLRGPLETAQAVEMPFRYSSEFRHKACERMLAGEPAKDLVIELSVSDATLYKWRRQTLVDAGGEPAPRASRSTLWPTPGVASRIWRPS